MTRSDWIAMARDVGPMAVQLAALLILLAVFQSFWVTFVVAVVLAVIAVIATAMCGFVLRNLGEHTDG